MGSIRGRCRGRLCVGRGTCNSVGWVASFSFELIFSSQPFRERAGADADLGSAEHGVEEAYLGDKAPFGVASSFAFNNNAAFFDPQQAPFLGQVLKADDSRGAQIITALSHSLFRLAPDRLLGIDQKIRPRGFAFNKGREPVGPTNNVRVFLLGRREFVENC
jgi:hypothetical protein